MFLRLYSSSQILQRAQAQRLPGSGDDVMVLELPFRAFIILWCRDCYGRWRFPRRWRLGFYEIYRGSKAWRLDIGCVTLGWETS